MSDTVFDLRHALLEICDTLNYIWGPESPFITFDFIEGHRNILNFKRTDGTLLRPFNTIEEHDETIIERHNRVVQPTERVYMLGDVSINRHCLHLLSRLNGRLVLVKGNHDIFKLKDYLPYFDDIRAYVVQKDQDGNKVILSHIPIHPDSVGRFGTNIHGHLHDGTINDPRYICVSMEHINYQPITISEALKLRKLRE